MKKILLLTLLFCSVSHFSCWEYFAGIECTQLVECGKNGSSTFVEYRAKCFCNCRPGFCGKFCEFERIECRGSIETQLYEGTEYTCFCKCPETLGTKLDPPSCDRKKVFHKLIGLLKSNNPDYFPLNQSNSWTYDLLDTMGNVINEFTNFIEYSYIKQDSIFNPVSISYPDSTGLDMDTIPGLLFFELENNPDTIYQYSNGEESIYLRHFLSEGDTLLSDGDSVFVTGLDSITVPAGTFYDCLSVLGVFGTGYILAPNIGIVAVQGTGGVIAAELRTYDAYCSFSTYIVVQNARCEKNGNGSFLIELEGSGQGVTSLDDLDISWDGPVTPNDDINPTNLVPGFYSVTITNGLCEAVIDSLHISGPPEIDIMVENIQAVRCSGNTDGSALLSVSGGSGPIEITLNGNPVVAGMLQNLDAGTYSVNASDSLSCSQSFEFTIPETNPISTNPIIQNVPCRGSSSGAVIPSISGGTPPYSFLWDTGSDAGNLNGLAGGEYSLTVSDSNGCTEVFNYTVDEPEEIIASTQVLNNQCFGESSGEIDLQVTGGTPPYTYNWVNGAITEDLSALTTGNYALTITDGNNCTVEYSFTISEPDNLEPSLDISYLSCHNSQDGTITLSTAGGTPPFTYEWNTGDTTADLNMLNAGIYSATITDSNECTVDITAEVIAPTELDVSETISNITCFNSSDGSISIAASGGTSPYSYSWNTGDTTDFLDELPAGEYTVTITDVNNCSSSTAISMDQPDALAATTQTFDISCYGYSDGSIDVTISGGTPPFIFSWNNGSTTEDIGQVSAGTYIVTVSDSRGCEKSFEYTLAQPEEIVVIIDTQDAACSNSNDGSIRLNPLGGTPPYSYSWNTGDTMEELLSLTPGSYRATITDTNNCQQETNVTIHAPQEFSIQEDIEEIQCYGMSSGEVALTVTGGTSPYNYSWSNGGNTESIGDLQAGTYGVTISDANNCTASEEYTVMQPEELLLNLSSENATGSMDDGTASVEVSGGIPPYSYLWDDMEMQTSKEALDLVAGNYSVTVTDANGCEQIGSVEVLMSTSVLETTKENALVLFPNPVSHLLTIRNTSNTAIKSISLITLDGELLFRKNSGISRQNTLDVSQHPQGQYILNVTFFDGESIKKIFLKI